MNRYDLGKVAVTADGFWSNSKAYERLTIVVMDAAAGGDGCGYISLKDNIGVRPGTDPTTWQIAAQAGQSIYELCVKHGTFVGTEAEFVAQYNAAVAAAEAKAAAADAAAGRANAAGAAAEALATQLNGLINQWTEAEDGRVTAEEDRVAAETAREREFATEMAASRTATGLAEEKAAAANAAAAAATTAAGTANAAAASADAARQAIQEDLAERAMRDEDAVEGNFAEFDASGNPVDAGFKASRIHRDLGYNATQQTITLTAGETGKYVKCATRSAVANASFAISAPINVDACSELLIKTGYNPSDQDHAALDISVIAIYEEIERTRTVQKKNGNNQPLYYEVDEEGNPTDVETTVVTDFPVYIQETYTEQRYLPNNEDRFVAIPDSRYYVAIIPQSCKCVISYKPGATDMNVIVVKHGALANLASQIFGIYEHRVMVEALSSIAYRVQALEAGIGKLGNATAGTLDVLEILKYKAPLILHGHGAPSAATAPDNWPADLPWDGIPVFIGQQYIDLDAAEGGLYYAVGFTAVANWKKA